MKWRHSFKGWNNGTWTWPETLLYNFKTGILWEFWVTVSIDQYFSWTSENLFLWLEPYFFRKQPISSYSVPSSICIVACDSKEALYRDCYSTICFLISSSRLRPKIRKVDFSDDFEFELIFTLIFLKQSLQIYFFPLCDRVFKKDKRYIFLIPSINQPT